MARWADYLQEMIGGLGFQIWDREGLAELWGFEKAVLGFAETGLGMADVDLASLPFPTRDTLLAYASRAFAEADHAVARVTDDQFHRQVQDRHGAEWEETTIGEAIVSWLAHDSRHLGMIECLIGARGLRGTATR
jgi:hypothetical protein